jgi:hypothetical protein
MTYDTVNENVPDFVKRLGDQTLQGSNNTIVVFGRDRVKKGPATVDDGVAGKGAGAIHVIVGRADKNGNPDIDADLATAYVSMKSDIDAALGTTVEGTSSNVPAIALKSDALRLVARKDLKIVIDGSQTYIVISDGHVVLKSNVGSITLDKDKITIDAPTLEVKSQNVIVGADKVSLGSSSAAEPAVLGNQWVDLMSRLLDAISQITVVDSMAATLMPVNAAVFTALRAEVASKAQLSGVVFAKK